MSSSLGFLCTVPGINQLKYGAHTVPVHVDMDAVDQQVVTIGPSIFGSYTDSLRECTIGEEKFEAIVKLMCVPTCPARDKAKLANFICQWMVQFNHAMDVARANPSVLLQHYGICVRDSQVAVFMEPMDLSVGDLLEDGHTKISNDAAACILIAATDALCLIEKHNVFDAKMPFSLRNMLLRKNGECKISHGFLHLAKTFQEFAGMTITHLHPQEWCQSAEGCENLRSTMWALGYAAMRLMDAIDVKPCKINDFITIAKNCANYEERLKAVGCSEDFIEFISVCFGGGGESSTPANLHSTKLYQKYGVQMSAQERQQILADCIPSKTPV